VIIQCIIPEVNGNGVAIVVHKSLVRTIVKKFVYNSRIVVVTSQAEPINILIMQVYMPTSEYEDDEVETLYAILEEILEEDGKGDTNTIIMGSGIVLLEMNHTGKLLDHMD
jgi:exonuclease III